MKFVKLLSTAYVNGVMRHPHEGVLHIEDAEADRLFEAEAAEDVTSDFTAKENKAVPVEGISTDAGRDDAPAGANPHLSEVLEDKAAAKPAVKKETGK